MLLKGRSWIWILPVLLLWEGIFRLNLFSPLVFPSPGQVFLRLWQDLLSGELPRGILFSLSIILISLIPAAILGFLMAFLSLRYRWVDSLSGKLSALAHPLPGIALLPLFIIWTGLGFHTLVLIVIHSVIWPFYINVRSGFREIPPLWIEVGRNNGFSRSREFFHIYLPASLPSVLAGLKIGWARSWRAVISAEMIFGTIGTGGGLGWFIYNKRIFMDTPGMIGGLFVLMIIGLLVEYGLFRPWEDRVQIRWGRGHVRT